MNRLNREILSQAVGGIDEKYIAEALDFRPNGRVEARRRVPFGNRSVRSRSKSARFFFGRQAAVALLLLCLLIGYGPTAPTGATVRAYACGTNEEISGTGTALSSGSIADDGKMRGHPLTFYIVGKDIAAVRFSCKNQWIDFVDWTQKRGEYGRAKNFTVSYGGDESEYASLRIDWVPDDTIRALTDHPDTTVAGLPPALREDVIVLQITYENGGEETKAMKVRLERDGRFVASFGDYTVAEGDAFIDRPDSPPANRDVLRGKANDSRDEEGGVPS